MEIKPKTNMKRLITLAFVAILGTLGMHAQEVAEGSLPLTIKAYDDIYIIEKYEVQKDDKGKTMVLFIGKGFDTLPFRDGNIRIPVWCKMISNGKEFEPVAGGAKDHNGVCYFDTDAKPDALIIYPGDDPDKKTKILCKTSGTPAQEPAKDEKKPAQDEVAQLELNKEYSVDGFKFTVQSVRIQKGGYKVAGTGFTLSPASNPLSYDGVLGIELTRTGGDHEAFSKLKTYLVNEKNIKEDDTPALIDRSSVVGEPKFVIMFNVLASAKKLKFGIGSLELGLENVLGSTNDNQRTSGNNAPAAAVDNTLLAKCNLCKPVKPEDNKIGLAIESISKGDGNSFHVQWKSTTGLIKRGTMGQELVAALMWFIDPDNPSNKKEGLQSTFSGNIGDCDNMTVTMDSPAKSVIIYFEGIRSTPKADNKESRTAPLFFMVELGDNPKLLDETPRYAGDLFEGIIGQKSFYANHDEKAKGDETPKGNIPQPTETPAAPKPVPASVKPPPPSAPTPAKTVPAAVPVAAKPIPPPPPPTPVVQPKPPGRFSLDYPIAKWGPKSCSVAVADGRPAEQVKWAVIETLKAYGWTIESSNDSLVIGSIMRGNAKYPVYVKFDNKHVDIYVNAERNSRNWAENIRKTLAKRFGK